MAYFSGLDAESREESVVSLKGVLDLRLPRD